MNEQDQTEAIEKIKRTFQLANYCIANIAAYRVNWKSIDGKRSPKVNIDFWVRANGAFFDMSVIEWCKLFADLKGKHHWSKIIITKDEWKNKLLRHMHITDEQYEIELLKIKDYRDKYVAHLDNPISMNYPLTEFMLKSASFLYDFIKENEVMRTYIIGSYNFASDYYQLLTDEYSQEIELRLIQTI